MYQFKNDKFWWPLPHMEQVSSTRRSMYEFGNDKISWPLPTWNKFHQLEVSINSGMTKFSWPSFINLKKYVWIREWQNFMTTTTHMEQVSSTYVHRACKSVWRDCKPLAMVSLRSLQLWVSHFSNYWRCAIIWILNFKF